MAEAARRLPRSTSAELLAANTEPDGARKLIITYVRMLRVLFREAAKSSADAGWAAIDAELVARHRELWATVVPDWNDVAVAERVEAQATARFYISAGGGRPQSIRSVVAASDQGPQ